VDSAKGATSLFQGYDANHPLSLDLENVGLDNTTQTSADANIGLYNSNVGPSGPDVTVTPIARASGWIPTCQFPAFTCPPAQ
jgi:polygalacturonase